MKPLLEQHYFSVPISLHKDSIENTTFSANWHNDIEILYITNGTGKIYSNFTPIPVKKGDVVIVNSNYVHYPASKSRMEIYCLIIDDDFCNKNGIDTKSILFSEKINDKYLLTLIEKTVSESEKYDIYKNPSVTSCILELMVYLARNHSKQNLISTRKITALRIQDAIRYMEDHFSENLTGDKVAKEINISKFYFLHELKETTNYTFSEFLNLLRCNHAKSLLISGDLSVKQVATLCGYENASYFSKTFKKLNKLSPLQFAKRYQDRALEKFEPKQQQTE